jgi:hypothetical protein
VNGVEIKNALMSGCAVSCDGVDYAKVSAIIYRCVNGQIKVTAELLDKGGNSVTIVPSDRVSESKK